MASDEKSTGRRDSAPLRRQGEEAIGKLAQDLLQSPVVSGAISTVFETRERATRAQELAMSALNLPSAADLERLTRRVRSVAQRIEGVEESLDRITDTLERADGAGALAAKLDALEAALARVEAKLDALGPEPVVEPAPVEADDAGEEPVGGG